MAPRVGRLLIPRRHNFGRDSIRSWMKVQWQVSVSVCFIVCLGYLDPIIFTISD